MNDIATTRPFWRSPAVKLLTIGCLILGLTIPLFALGFLLMERQLRADTVTAEVGDAWGGVQRIAGPFLIVPYRVIEREGEGANLREKTLQRYAVFLPEQLVIGGRAETQIRKRSIFDVAVFRADLSLSGNFKGADMAELTENADKIMWDKAWLALAVSDVRAFKQAMALRLEGSANPISFEPSIGIPNDQTPGVHAGLPPGAAQAGFKFTVPLVLNGTQSLSFVPAGRESRVQLTSDWPHPSFFGSFLPDSHTISDSGFTASWFIPHLARSVPQQFTYGEQGFQPLENFALGVRFFQSVDFYQLVARSLKYGILFVAAGFLIAFLMEALSAQPLHIVQYFFIGLAQVVFYLLLLSLSEHLGFATAYGVATAATVGLISLYVLRATGKMLRGGVMLIALLFAYGLLYLLLRLEDYALIVGAIAVFLALAITMFATLKVDWSRAR